MAIVYAALGIALFCALATAWYVYKAAATRKGVSLARFGDLVSMPAPYRDVVREGVAWGKAQRMEHLWIESFDGLRLHARFFPAKNARRTILCAHGFRGDPFRDFACATRYYHERDCNLLLIDQRAHGQSEGAHLTFGVRERYDIRDWVRYLSERLGDDHPVYLDGISMGASAVMMAAGLPLPRCVRGVIADCGFTTPYAIVGDVLKRVMHIPPVPVVWLVDLYCRAFAGFSLRGASAPEALAHTDLPVLIAHGRADRFVPFGMAGENIAACRTSPETVFADDAGHGLTYLYAREAYERAIQSLFDRCEPR